MHGLEQSEALTRAAQKLSSAKEDFKELSEWSGSAPRLRAADRLESAEIVYRAAYKAYTNPFNVRKTS